MAGGKRMRKNQTNSEGRLIVTDKSKLKPKFVDYVLFGREFKNYVYKETQDSLPAFSIDENAFIMFDDKRLGGAGIFEVYGFAATEQYTWKNATTFRQSQMIGNEAQAKADKVDTDDQIARAYAFGDDRHRILIWWTRLLNTLCPADPEQDMIPIQIMVRYFPYRTVGSSALEVARERIDSMPPARNSLSARLREEYLDLVLGSSDMDKRYGIGKPPAAMDTHYYIVVPYTPSSEESGIFEEGRDSDYYARGVSGADNVFVQDKTVETIGKAADFFNRIFHRDPHNEEDYLPISMGQIDEDETARVIMTRMNIIQSSLYEFGNPKEGEERHMPPFVLRRITDPKETGVIMHYFDDPFCDDAMDMLSYRADIDDAIYDASIDLAVRGGIGSVVEDGSIEAIMTGTYSVEDNMETADEIIERYKAGQLDFSYDQDDQAWSRSPIDLELPGTRGSLGGRKRKGDEPAPSVDEESLRRAAWSERFNIDDIDLDHAQGRDNAADTLAYINRFKNMPLSPEMASVLEQEARRVEATAQETGRSKTKIGMEELSVDGSYGAVRGSERINDAGSGPGWIYDKDSGYVPAMPASQGALGSSRQQAGLGPARGAMQAPMRQDAGGTLGASGTVPPAPQQPQPLPGGIMEMDAPGFPGSQDAATSSWLSPFDSYRNGLQEAEEPRVAAERPPAPDPIRDSYSYYRDMQNAPAFHEVKTNIDPLAAGGPYDGWHGPHMPPLQGREPKENGPRSAITPSTTPPYGVPLDAGAPPAPGGYGQQPFPPQAPQRPDRAVHQGMGQLHDSKRTAQGGAPSAPVAPAGMPDSLGPSTRMPHDARGQWNQPGMQQGYAQQRAMQAGNGDMRYAGNPQGADPHQAGQQPVQPPSSMQGGYAPAERAQADDRSPWEQADQHNPWNQAEEPRGSDPWGGMRGNNDDQWDWPSEQCNPWEQQPEEPQREYNPWEQQPEEPQREYNPWEQRPIGDGHPDDGGSRNASRSKQAQTGKRRKALPPPNGYDADRMRPPSSSGSTKSTGQRLGSTKSTGQRSGSAKSTSQKSGSSGKRPSRQMTGAELYAQDVRDRDRVNRKSAGQDKPKRRKKKPGKGK
jgi:hypothetical protein